MASKALFRWVVDLDKGVLTTDFPRECAIYDIALEYIICDFHEYRHKTAPTDQESGSSEHKVAPEVAHVLLQTQYAPFKQLTYIRKNGMFGTIAWLPSLRNFPVVEHASVYDFTHSLQYCTIDLRNDSQVLFRLADSTSSTIEIDATLSLSVVKRHKAVYE